MRCIVRAEHNKGKPYLQVAKSTIRDNGVPFEVRGFLIFLLAKPDDWEVRPDQLAEECGIHRATVYRLLKKLIESGYARRKDIKVRLPNGTIHKQVSIYTVFEDKESAILWDMKAIPF